MEGIIKTTTITDLSVFKPDNYPDLLLLQIAFAEPKRPRTVHNFVMGNPIDVQRVLKLFEYTNSTNLEELDGKQIKTAYKDHFTYGFCALDGNKFIPLLTKDLIEVTEEEILKM